MGRGQSIPFASPTDNFDFSGGTTPGIRIQSRRCFYSHRVLRSGIVSCLGAFRFDRICEIAIRYLSSLPPALHFTPLFPPARKESVSLPGRDESHHSRKPRRRGYPSIPSILKAPIGYSHPIALPLTPAPPLPRFPDTLRCSLVHLPQSLGRHFRNGVLVLMYGSLRPQQFDRQLISIRYDRIAQRADKSLLYYSRPPAPRHSRNLINRGR